MSQLIVFYKQTKGAKRWKAAHTTWRDWRHVCSRREVRLYNGQAIKVTEALLVERKAGLPDRQLVASLDFSLKDVGLGSRSFGALWRSGFETVGDVFFATRHELQRIPNLGPKSWQEIDENFREIGISLPNLPLWP